MTDQVTVEGGRTATLPAALLLEASGDRAPNGALVWAWLECRYADRQGEAWPGRRRLADDLGISVDTIDRALKWLVDHHWLVVEARYDQAGDRASNLYRLLRGVSRKNLPQVAADTRPPGSRKSAALSSITAIERASAAGKPSRTYLGVDRQTELHRADDVERDRVRADLAGMRERLGFAPAPTADVEVEQ